MVRDAFGYEAGPDGRGTDLPPAKGWSVYGVYEDQREALQVAGSMNQEDELHGYQRHPERSNVVIWTCQKHMGIKVHLDPPDAKLFAYLERTYGQGHVEYLGPSGHNGADQYFCIKPDRSGGIYYTDSSNVVGRTMTNSKEKNALVVGDDSGVRDWVQEGTAGTSDAGREPDQQDYDDFWESVYEATGALVRERDDKAYAINRGLGDWYCEVSNFGWRNQNGNETFSIRTHKESDLSVGQQFLRAILPNTDCTFYIYDDCTGFGLKIDNAHHDAPTGGEWYHCAPLAWMMKAGCWWGLQNDSDEMIPEIHDALLEEWETEFLNKELSAIAGTPQEKSRGDRWWQGTGQRLALDIEFPTLYKKFKSQFGVTTDKFLSDFKQELEDFYYQYYASSVVDEWKDYLPNCNFNGFGEELRIFFRTGNFQVGDRTIPDEMYKRLEKIYEQSLK